MSMRHPVIRQLPVIGMFIVLLVCFGALRTMPVFSRGLLEHDEGHALLNAHTWHQAMRWVLGGGLWGAGEPVGELGAAMHRGGGTLYSAGKLGYTLLVAVVALPGQVSTTLALVLAWLSGLAICGLAGALVRQMTGSWWGAGVAVIGCMSSPLLMMLATEASGTNWALMLGLVAAWLALVGVDRAADGRRAWTHGVLAGVCLGYGFTCHFNLAPMVLAVFLMTAVQVRASGRGAGQPTRRKMLGAVLVPMMISSAGVLVVFEIATQGVRYALRHAFPDFLSFFGEHRRLFFRDQVPMLDGVLYGDGAIGWGAEAWMVYLGTLAREDWLWGVLVIASAVLLLGPSGRPWRARLAPVVVLLLVPVAFWALYVYRVERVLGMCIATSWVLVGCVAGLWMKERPMVPRVKALLLAPFFSLLMGDGLARRSALMERSAEGITRMANLALEDMRRHGGQITAGSFDTGFAPLWKWELVEQLRQPGSADLRPLVDFSRFAGAEMIFVDPSAWRRPSGAEFPLTQNQVEAGRLVGSLTNKNPEWELKVYDIRGAGSAQIDLP